MLSIKKILKLHSNGTIAARSGYPEDFIHRFRKNKIDEFAIQIDEEGRGIPTRAVLEKRILESFETKKGI